MKAYDPTHPSYSQYGDGRAVIWTKDGPALDLKACTFEPLPSDTPPSPSEWWQRLTIPQRARVMIDGYGGCYNLSEPLYRACFRAYPLLCDLARCVVDASHGGRRKSRSA